MKKLCGILTIFVFTCNLIFAQENLFEKIKTNFTISKSANEKIERFKSRQTIKQWEQIRLNPSIVLAESFKGIFNIFDKNIKFEITKDYGTDINGVQGYKAELKEGGYAILSSSNKGIGASVWYKENFYRIEAVEDEIYFVSELDIDEIAKHENPNDYGSLIKLNKITQGNSVASALSAATIKVFVAYTPAVAQNYNVYNLINECRNVTNNAYSNSLVSSTIELAGSAQLTYAESGDDYTDVTRFMTKNDSYLDNIHSLRNQYDADVCVLLVNTLNSNGRVPDDAIGASRDLAFFVVKASSAASNYSFAHELGHLLGCRHETDTNIFPYENARGYNWYGKLSYDPNIRFYRTIMSAQTKYMRVPYFSNPYVYDQINNPMGTLNTNYCASAIDDYASSIAGFAPYHTASGTLTENEWWEGTINITGNVTVPSSITLTIESGAQISFSSGSSLTINGSLIAVGTSANRITFTRSGTSGTWGGIEFNSGSSGNVQYCNINYAAVGIKCNSSSPTIQNNILNNITNIGIYLYNASPSLLRNTIQGSSGSYGSNGIRCEEYSSPYIAKNTIRYFTTGINNYRYCSPNFSENSFSEGHNKIVRTSTAIYGWYYSSPRVGQNGYPWGYNYIDSASTYNIKAESYTNIMAENNWWGTSSPPANKFNAVLSSSIDYTPYLSSPPSLSIREPEQYTSTDMPVAMKIASGTASSDLSSNSLFDDEDINTALKYEIKQDYQSAFDIYEKVFKKELNTAKGKYALVRLGDCFFKLKRNGIDKYLNGISESYKSLKKDEISVMALDLINRELITNMEYEKVAANMRLIKNELAINAEIEKGTLYGLVSLYVNCYNDSKRALSYYEEIKEKYPGDKLLNDCKMLLGYQYDNSVNKELSDNENTANKIEGVETSNYPNPFNPTTTISYSLPEAGNVQIKVYDVLGREITKLVDETKSAGKHTVAWNGSNNASGIYFYTITFNNQTLYKKMLMIK